MRTTQAILLMAAIILAGVFLGFRSRTRAVARVAVDRIEHDFGRVRYGEVARTAFRISNAGKMPVAIGAIRTSCGCTAAEIDRRFIPAVEAATLAVSFDPAVHKDDSDLGNVERLVFVETNDPAHAELVFRIRASVYK